VSAQGGGEPHVLGTEVATFGRFRPIWPSPGFSPLKSLIGFCAILYGFVLVRVRVLIEACAGELAASFVRLQPFNVHAVATTGLVVALPLVRLLQVTLSDGAPPRRML